MSTYLSEIIDIFQMNSALTKTDTSLWLTKWIPHSRNWLDINPYRYIFSKKFTFEINNYLMILSKNITTIKIILMNQKNTIQ